MTIAAYAAVTRAQVKAYGPFSGTALDAFIDEECGRWTREVERFLGRRLVYRAPTEDDDSILTATAWATSTPAPTGQPTAPGRTLVVTFPSTATAGILTVTGTVAGVLGVTEAFDVTTGPLTLYGVKFFTAVSGIAITGASGTGNVKVGTSVGLVEYHSPSQYSRSPSRLRAADWPIRQVADLNEDSTGVYDAGTGLVFGTSYTLYDRQYLVRSDGGQPVSWTVGSRSVRVIYSAGYFTVANVPPEIQSVILELIVWNIRHTQRGMQGTASGTDGTGTFVFQSGPPFITEVMAGRLRDHKNPDTSSASRDFDEEAA